MYDVLLRRAKSGCQAIGKLCAQEATFATRPGRGHMARRGLTIIAVRVTDGMTTAVPRPTDRTTTITAVAKKVQM